MFPPFGHTDAGNAAAKQRTRHLTNILPEYFCDNPMFPYNTLAQFYAKMGRALNKGVEKVTSYVHLIFNRHFQLAVIAFEKRESYVQKKNCLFFPSP